LAEAGCGAVGGFDGPVTNSTREPLLMPVLLL
jgi:hypothetical protein